MFWWYERGGTFTRVEVAQLSTGEYQLRILAPDGTEHIEQVSTHAELMTRFNFVRAQLRDTEWSGPTTGPT